MDIETELINLPVGTKFWVVNGAWNGEIVEIDGKKYIHVIDHDTFELKPGQKLVIQIYEDGEADW